MDCGKSLNESPAGPWKLEDRVPDGIFPIMQYQPRISLAKHSVHPNPFVQGRGKIDNFFQSPMLLPYAYANMDRWFDHDIAAADAIYALHPIIRLGLTSEHQLLNLIDRKLVKELDPLRIIYRRDPSISNLLNYRQELERHIQRDKELVAFLENCRDSEWPKAIDQKQMRVVEKSTDKLKTDLQHLLSRAQTLSEKCDRSVIMVSNNEAILESRRTYTQAESMTRFTRLAFVFIPASFMTSFFGMNVYELGSNHIKMWIFFAVAIPVVMIFLLVLNWEIFSLFQRLLGMQSWFGKGKKRKTDSFVHV